MNKEKVAYVGLGVLGGVLLYKGLRRLMVNMFYDL